MTKEEQTAHVDTLVDAQRAAEKAVRRVMEELNDPGLNLLGPLEAIRAGFASAIGRVQSMPVEE